ncbi:hypothetical protein PR003_g9234 [Phytophthora rubi]|uniref:Secreted protein n=1 Tax=Phytophthora rubi TaxID=129364 RepID=A0A6A3MWK5_9STRA|nr:hypothetical protein PR001_g10091 [Phytophthora rubi]KAE9342907.1 hypothetical protein PR003_g9234 [Phytophthora rubi]
MFKCCQHHEHYLLASVLALVAAPTIPAEHDPPHTHTRHSLFTSSLEKFIVCMTASAPLV